MRRLLLLQENDFFFFTKIENTLFITCCKFTKIRSFVSHWGRQVSHPLSQRLVNCKVTVTWLRMTWWNVRPREDWCIPDAIDPPQGGRRRWTDAITDHDGTGCSGIRWRLDCRTQRRLEDLLILVASHGSGCEVDGDTMRMWCAMLRTSEHWCT